MGIVAVNDLMYLAVLQRQLGRFPGQVTMVLDGFVCVWEEKVRSLDGYALPAVAIHRSNPQKVPVHSPAPVVFSFPFVMLFVLIYFYLLFHLLFNYGPLSSSNC